MYDEPLFLAAGDRALVIELDDDISPEVNGRVRNLMLAIQNADIPEVVELVPTYRSLLVYYDPLRVSASELEDSIKSVEHGLDEEPLEKPVIVHIPTLYGGQYGPDLKFVAEHAGLTTEEVVSIHSQTDYLVYMIGFSPGFPYLGGLSEKLHTPRLDTPRTEISGGSVGIAESQTGVYPLASPGGWRLIGRTPLRLFDPNSEPPGLLNACDYVRFVPIATEAEYLEIQRRVETGEHVVVKEAAP